ncbi:MAG TPA: hydrogenase nickel incorporation protein HypB [Methylocystis sp.]|nr:hydrogenase nickel incorporation protein HypB [Methylocystis sp.]
MCKTCGCGEESESSLLNMQTGRKIDLATQSRPHSGAANHHWRHHDHPHDGDSDLAHASGHVHRHEDGVWRSHAHEPHGHEQHSRRRGETLDLQARILAKNDAIAAQNRAWLTGREILALNIMSSPGAGKTTFLERTIAELKGEAKLFVIEGDQATSADGERIRAAGAAAVQVNTGAGCHLEADMIARGLAELRPTPGSIVMIENVGNLVCPALFDLGESSKVVMLSVTEGEDKPLKYPHMFRAARLIIINKIDLAPHVDFDRDRCIANARRVNPGVEALELSSRTGEGFEAWRSWLLREAAETHERAFRGAPPGNEAAPIHAGGRA